MTVASRVKETLATLKGVQGTLRVYSLQSQDKETVSVYKDALTTTGRIIEDLEKRIKKIEFQEPQYKGN